MKKLLFMMFLMMGTLGFAGNDIDPVKVVKDDTTFWCCTVGNIRQCRGPFEGDACAAARAIYCMTTSCVGSGGSGGSGTGCIQSKGCNCGGDSSGSSSNN